jgi:hypothetical protein
MQNINSLLLQYAHIFAPLPQDKRITELTRRVLLVAVPLFLALAALFYPRQGLGSQPITPPPPPPRDPPAAKPSVLEAPTAASIKTVYEGMFPNFGDNLIGSKGEQLRKMIADYKAAGDVQTKKTAGDVDPVEEIELHLAYFFSLRQNIFSYTGPRIDPANIISSPPQGDCLFITAGRGLQMLKGSLVAHWPVGSTIPEGELNHDAFRAEVVAWMREHDEGELSQQIDAAIEAYKAAKLRHLNFELQSANATIDMINDEIYNDPQNGQLQNQLAAAMEQPALIEAQIREVEAVATHDDYFNLVQNVGFFASGAELYAISTMYHVQIKVVRMIGNRRVEGFDLPFHPEYGEPSITVVHKNGDHFDLEVPR